MRERNAYIYVPRFTQESLAHLEDALQSVDFRLYHPDTNTVTAVLREEDIQSETQLIGEYLTVSKDWLTARIRHRTPTSFIWWGPEWCTLFCSIHFDALSDELLLGLEEVAGHPLEPVVLKRLETFFWGIAADRNAVGMVLDPDGLTETYDWRAFFQTGAGYSGPLPRLLIIPVSMRMQVSAQMNYVACDQRDGFLVIRPH